MRQQATHSGASLNEAIRPLILIVALVGGIWPALFAAIASGLTLNFFFVAPALNITGAVGSPVNPLAMK